MKDNWIEKLKVGDEVIVNSGYGLGIRFIAKVEKVNKASVNVEGALYDLSGNKKPRDPWCANYISPCTEEVKDEVKEEMFRRNICRKLSTIVWSNLSTEKLLAIQKILKEEK